MKNYLNLLTKNKSLLLYFLLVALIMALLGLTNCCFAIGYRNHLLSLNGIVHFMLIHLGDAVLLLLPYWLLPSRWRKWIWTVPTILSIWCFAQIIYNITYQEIMPFTSFLFTSNIGNVLIDSVLGLIHFTALLPVFFTLVAWIIYRKWLYERAIEGNTLSLKHKCLSLITVISVALITQLTTTYRLYYLDGTYIDFKEAVDELYTRIGGRFKGYFLNHGFVAYTIHSIATSFEPPVSQEEINSIRQYLDHDIPCYTDNPFSVGRKNLILIIVESLNSWAINLKINGREVTPVLNRLAADSTNIVALKVQGQVKNGRSSDGKFIYDTGLLPLLDKAVVMHYGDVPYPSLAKALTGYQTMEICVDAPGLWNIEGTNRSYGFQKLYNQRQFKAKLIANGYRADELLLDEAAKTLFGCKRPFFAQIITATMHSPYDTPDVDTTWISHSKQYTLHVRNYLERVAYFDRHLGVFLKKLSSSGILKNSVVAIASDHTELVDDDPIGRPALSARGNDCTLIIMGAKKGKHISSVVGQIDVYPTLLDVMGRNNYPWKGLGYSLLRTNVKSAAVFPDEITGQQNDSLVLHQKRAWIMSSKIIKTRWFTHK